MFDGKNKMTAEREVIITVTNVEEDGTVTLSAPQPRVGVPLTASVEDIDGGVKDITWKWARSTDMEQFETPADITTIAGATSATYTPTAKDDIIEDGFYLRATASYTDGKGKDTADATSVSSVQLRTDNPPKFPKAEDGKRSIREDKMVLVDNAG